MCIELIDLRRDGSWLDVIMMRTIRLRDGESRHKKDGGVDGRDVLIGGT